MGLYIKEIKDTDYAITLFNEKRGEMVEGVLTAPVQIQTQSTWDSLTEQRGDNIIGYVAQAYNKSTLVQAFTHQVWRGSEIPQFTFQFSFVGITSAQNDVMKPVEELLKWPLSPKLSGGFFEPPATKNAYCYVVNSWLFLHFLFPTTCDVQFNPTLDQDSSKPIQAEATISFTYGFAPTAQDIESWLW